MKISVIGLGKLGSPLAAVLAGAGFEVIGTDVRRGFVDAIKVRRAPVDEPGLQDLIDGAHERLSATTDGAAAVEASEVTFVVVPTPSDAHGGFSNACVLTAMDTIGVGLRRKSGYHLVVVTSTVMPGSVGSEIREALERHTGRTVGADLGLCYSPLFVAIGSIVRDMLRPDMVLIGESDEKAGEVLEAIYGRCCNNRPVVRRMNFVNAELTKIAVNTFVTTKISYANMLADICERLAGADVDMVTQAMGSDTRIGSKCLRGAIGYGGPCFPRDNVAFAALARSAGARADLAKATDALNHYQLERVLRSIDARFTDSGAIGVLGLSYKPDTAVVEHSQGLALVERLLDSGRRVVAYDPKALRQAQAELRGSFDDAVSAEACVRASALVVLMTPWPEFRAIPATAFERSGGRLPVIDCWRMMGRDIAAVADVVYVGQGAGQVTTTLT